MVAFQQVLDWFNDARNKSAHLQPLNLGELTELIAACRDHY